MKTRENEIKAEIVVLEKYAKETKDRLESLHQQLAGAEKPKLEHGDFGLVWDEGESEKPSRFVVTNHKGNLHWCRHSGLPSLIPLFHLTEYKYLIFGNILKFTEEWGKDLEEFEFEDIDNKVTLVVEKSNTVKDIFIGVKDTQHFNRGVHLTIPEFYEIWLKLGTALFTLKRKQSK